MLKINKGASRRAALVAILLLAGVVLPGCSSKEERQAQYLRRAQDLYAEGDYSKATVEVRNVLQIDGDHPQGRYLYALLLERDQNWRQMFANLQLAVDLDPDFADARIKLGQTYYRVQAYDNALEQAEEVLRLAPGNVDALTLRGSVFYRRGDVAAALEQARSALDIDPGHVGATSIIAEIYKGEEPTRALDAIADAMQQQTDAETLILLKINVLEGQGDTAAVIREYQGLIESHPDNLFYHYKLVKFYEDLGRVDEAEELLRSIVKTEPDNLPLKLWLAEFLANQRDLNLAEEAVREFIEREPGIYELRFALGKIYTALQQYSDAESVYREIIELDGEGADAQQARNEVVKLRLAQSDEAGARAILNEIFAIENENTDALVTTARLSLAKGDLEAAIPQLRTAIKNTPSNYEALLLLAKAHELEGARDLALDNYRNAVVMRPGSREALLGAARLLTEAGDAAAARQLLEPYVDANPEQGDAISLLVGAYVADGEIDRAMTVAEETLASDDNASLGHYLKGRLLLVQESSQAAIDNFKASLELERQAEQPLRYLVQAWMSEGKTAKAEAYLRKHTAALPDEPLGYELLAEVMAVDGRRGDAKALYEKAIELAPQRVSALRGITRLADGDEELEGVLPLWEAAIDLSANVALRVELASVYERLGEKDLAKAAYRTALDLRPDDPVAANNLIMLIIDNEPNEKEMEEALMLSTTLHGQSESAYQDTLGWLSFRIGDFQRALEFLLPLAQHQEADAIYLYHLGATLIATGDPDSAFEYLSQAVDARNADDRDELHEAEKLLASLDRGATL